MDSSQNLGDIFKQPSFGHEVKEEAIEVRESPNFSVKEEGTELDARASLSETSTNYVCLLCKLNFSSFFLVYHHVDLAHNITYKCEMENCPESLFSITSYKIHLMYIHENPNPDAMMLKILKSSKLVADGTYIVDCMLCAEDGTIEEIQSHAKKRHYLFCRVCGIDFKNNQDFIEHKTQHFLGKIQLFNCSVCRKGFKTIDLVKTHYNLIHHKLEPDGSVKFIYTIETKRFSQALLPEDCPFCEARIPWTQLQAHFSWHAANVAKKLITHSRAYINSGPTIKLPVSKASVVPTEPNIPLNSGESLQEKSTESNVEASKSVKDKPPKGKFPLPKNRKKYRKHKRLTSMRKSERIRKALRAAAAVPPSNPTPVPTPAVTLCTGCQSILAGPEALCPCRIAEEPRTTRLCLNLSEFTQCKSSCQDCKATLWRYKYVVICLSCLPRDVASLDINLRIIPKAAVEIEPEKCGDAPMERPVNIVSIKSTDAVSVNSEPEIGEPTHEIFSMDPQSPESETNPDSADLDDETSGEPPWIETAPDAVWSSEPAVPALTPCDYCPKMFQNYESAHAHIMKSHPEYSQYICGWCSEQYNGFKSFRSHRATHRLDLCSLCEICGEKHLTAGNLTRHRLSKHGTSKVNCPKCNKSYNNTISLKDHLRLLHNTEKRIICEHCPKRFRYRAEIESHMQTHTGVFMHRCKLCTAKFTRNDNLNQHVKYNHNFACPICGLTLPTAAEVRRHRGEAHTREQLEASQAQGEGEFVRFTPFQCEVCSRFLASKQSLDKHLTTHTRPAAKQDKKSREKQPRQAVRGRKTKKSKDKTENMKEEGQENVESVNNLQNKKRKINQNATSP